jgi:hypothetical protein
MKKVAVALLGVLIVGCTTNAVGYNKPYPKSQLFCPKDTVEYCEGRTQRDLECTCIKKRVLEQELRRLVW